MELNKYQQEVFDNQRPVIEKFGKRAWGWTIFFLAVDRVGRICTVSTDCKRPWCNRYAGQCGLGLIYCQFYFLYWYQLCRCCHFRHSPYSKSGMAKTDHPYCRNDHGDRNHYWTRFYFIMCWQVRQASSSFSLSKTCNHPLPGMYWRSVLILPAVLFFFTSP